jgi:hypothetical protein
MSETPRYRVSARLALLASVLFLSACADREIEEHRVEKGIERLPSDAPSSPAQSTPSTPEPSSATPWEVPEGWVLDPTPRQMRIATYLADAPSGQVEIAITRFPGDVGGVLANINRWRGQMGLGPVSETNLESTISRFEAPGFSGYETRIESERGVMIAVGVHDQSIDQTWFVRATVDNPQAADEVQEQLFAMARSITRNGSGG